MKSGAQFSFRVAFLVAVTGLTAAFATGQSTLQDFPTPVTSNEITGSIPPREIGDSRLTTFYYLFDGSQGDLFINIVTNNFAGDIDVFEQAGLRPLSKIVIFGALEAQETGRVLYLRKPERLLLRIQGRTPNDDPATFRIKFAGSFLAVAEDAVPKPPELPTVARRTDEPTRPANEPEEVLQEERVADAVPAAVPMDRTVAETPKEKPKTSPQVLVTDPLAAKSPESTKTTTSQVEPPATVPKVDDRASAPIIGSEAESAPTSPEPEPAPQRRLVVRFRDGSSIDQPMTEIRRFSVERDQLVIIGSNGRPRRYQMATVLSVSIQ